MVNPRSDCEIPGACYYLHNNNLSSFLASYSDFHVVEVKTNNNCIQKNQHNSKNTHCASENTCKQTSTYEQGDSRCYPSTGQFTGADTLLLDSASDLFRLISESSTTATRRKVVDRSLHYNSTSKCGRAIPAQGAGFYIERASRRPGSVTTGGNLQHHFPPPTLPPPWTSQFHQVIDVVSAVISEHPRLLLTTSNWSSELTTHCSELTQFRDPITQVTTGVHQSIANKVGKFHFLMSAGGQSSNSGAGLRIPEESQDTSLLAPSSITTTTTAATVQLTLSESSHERRITNSAANTVSTVNEYGFFTNERIDAGLPPVIQYPESAQIDSKRNVKWRRMLGTNAEENWPAICEHNSKLLKKRIRKGIPRDWRYRVWPLLTGGQHLLDFNPGEYQRLLRQPCLVEHEILDDLHRTLPNHVLFSERGGDGQQALHRVLKAYACYDPELGYAQGTGSIIAGLLVVLEEECAFWTFVALMSDDQNGPRPKTAGPLIKARNLFLEGTPLTMEVMSKLEHLLIAKQPAIARKLRLSDIDTSLYAAKWCMTLFCFILPFQHLVRVWDVFFLEGWKIALRTCLVIMKLLGSRILQEPIETVGRVLTANTIAEQIPSPDDFIQMILATRVSKSLKTWRPQGGPDQL
eukprot:g3085.t1